MNKTQQHAKRLARVRAKHNPFLGRTCAERQRVTRYVHLIVDAVQYHYKIVYPRQPEWLAPIDITPDHESYAQDGVEIYGGAERDHDGYIPGLHIPGLKASNNVRVATWYKNEIDELYLICLRVISPLPCDDWGALPLTRAQWRILMPTFTLTHMHWKWIHSVRLLMHDDKFEVGGSFGWHMERNEILDKDESLLWTGEAIYSHIIRKFLNHEQEG
jgi:hypothetical protein